MPFWGVGGITRGFELKDFELKMRESNFSRVSVLRDFKTMEHTNLNLIVYELQFI